jgi:hypothetical protein
MDFVQVSRIGWLGHALHYALTERALHEQIWTGPIRAAFVVKRRPFVKAGWRCEIDLSVNIIHHICLGSSLNANSNECKTRAQNRDARCGQRRSIPRWQQHDERGRYD